MSRVRFLDERGPAQGYAAAAGPTASVGAAPSVLTSFALVSLDFSGSTDPAGGGLTYSATMDVKPAGSASALTDATTSTPDFTPDALGAYSGLLTVTDINGRTDTSRWFREVRSALTASLAVIPSQLTLAAIQGAATATGGIGTKTHSHTVNEATTGLSDPAVEDPTFTPTAAGQYTWVYTVTDAAGQTAKATRTFTVGDTGGQIKTHGVDWTAVGVAGSKTIPSSETLDGISIGYVTGGGGSPTIVAGATGLVMTPGGASSVSIEWTGSDIGASALAIGDLWTLFVAIDASLVGAGDILTMSFLNGTNRVYGRVYYDSGYKLLVGTIRAGSATETIFSLGAHPRQFALRFDGTTAQARSLSTAYSGAFPAFKTMTKPMVTRTSNKFTAFDPSVTDSADAPAITSSTARVTVQGSARTIAAHEIRWSPES